MPFYMVYKDEIAKRIFTDKKYGGDILKLYHIIKCEAKFREQSIRFNGQCVKVKPGDFITSLR